MQLPQSQEDLKEYNIDQMQVLEHLAILGHYVIYLLDLPAARYVYMSKTIEHFMNTTLEALADSGGAIIANLTHPLDKRGINAFNTRYYSLLYSLEEASLPSLTISYDYRMQTSHNKLTRVFQQNTVLSFLPDGTPKYKLGTGHDISAIKVSDVQHCRISWMEGETLKEVNLRYDQQNDQITEVEPLTPRQLQILFLLEEGKTSKQIGDLLHISPNTVDNHRRQLLERMQVGNTTALVMLARLHGLLSLPNGVLGSKSALLLNLIKPYLSVKGENWGKTPYPFPKASDTIAKEEGSSYGQESDIETLS